MKKVQCLICDKVLLLNYVPDAMHVLNTTDSLDDGGTIHVSFGYGSKYDFISATGAICDGCFKSKRKKFHGEIDALDCLRKGK